MRFSLAVRKTVIILTPLLPLLSLIRPYSGHFVALVAVTTAAHAAYCPASDPLVLSSFLLLLCIIPMRFVLSFASSQKLAQDSRNPSPACKSYLTCVLVSCHLRCLIDFLLLTGSVFAYIPSAPTMLIVSVVSHLFGAEWGSSVCIQCPSFFGNPREPCHS